MREWLARIIDWVRRDRLEAELDDELRFHRSQLERDARAAGESPDAATWSAKRQLGNVTRVHEDARERWSVPWLDHLRQDVRYAFRGLRRSPAFTLSAVITLGLGIGANAAMFGVIDRLMFRPHAYLTDPGRVHRVYLQASNRDRVETRDGIEYTRFKDLERWTTSFSDYAAYYNATMAIGTGDASRERRVAAVSASFFGFFDARPALGRWFQPSEDVTPVGANVAVLDYGFWQASFGGRSVLGEPLQVGRDTYTIIGVAPKGFAGVSEDTPPALYIPITTWAGHKPRDDGKQYYTNYAWGWLDVMVRRKPGVSIAAASADLSAAHARSWNAERAMQGSLPPVEIAKPKAIASSLHSAAGPDPGLEARTLLWVSGVAVIVLLIACANVANLFLARTLRRRREVALRIALGVSRGRLIAQSLTESLILSLMGCIVGIGVAQWGGGALRRLFLRDPSGFDLLTDTRTLLAAVAASIVAGLLTGIAPVMFGARGGLASTLKMGAREGTYQRSPARSALLITQGALSMALLVGAGLFVQSLRNVRDARMGFDADRILIVLRNFRGADMSDSDQVRNGRQLLAAARTIPGVEHAAWVSSIPFMITSTTRLTVPGIDSVARLGEFTYQLGTSDYFRTMGTRIVKGRGFTEADRANAPPIVVVSESMAKVLWRGADPLGKCVKVADAQGCTTVVGVAEDAAHNTITDEQRYRYYLPIEQFRPQNGYAVMLRMTGDPAQSVELVRKSLQAVMPGQSYVNVRQMRDLVDSERRSWQVGATMFVAFGVLALAVAAVGLYGVIAYNVAQRMQELGVRVALGAQSSDVVRLVVGQGVRFAVLGVTVGAVIAILAARWVQPLLYGQSATDVRVFGAVSAVLVAVAVLASSLPARRATRVDPNTVLRSE
jgi:predicted permease